MKPHRVYLNLSLEEFPNKLNDLPVDLISFIKKEPSVIINWVNGENTKTMKKVFPILKYLNDFDTIYDPCSGYSGRLIGALCAGKNFVGSDIKVLLQVY